VTDPRPTLTRAPRGRRLRFACTLATACVLAASCGKKGPPLAPLVRLPVAPAQVTAKRAGDRVLVRFTIPRQNQSGVQPADIEAVEVYAWTPLPPDPASTTPTPQLTPEQIFKYGKLVARVPVREPPPPPPEQKEGEPPPPPPPPPTGPGLDQGAVAEVVDALAPGDAEPIAVPVKKPKEAKAVPRDIVLTPPDVGLPLPPLPARLYAAVGVNHRGRRGAMSPPVRVPLWTPPPVPTDLAATVREGAVDLAWTAPPGLRHPLVTNIAPAPAGPGAGRPASGANRGSSAGAEAAPHPGAPRDGAAGQAPSAQPGEGEPPAALGDEDEEDLLEAQQRRESALQQAAQARAEAAKSAGQTVPEPPASAPEAVTPAPPLDPAAAGTLASRVPFPWPPTAGGYAVYEVLPPDVTAPGAAPPPAAQPFPKPLTAAPLKATTFTDPRLEFGVARCYVVRATETVGQLSMESEPSAPACISARDTFAPAAPKSLGAVSSAGAISLIWEANTEPDLAGYIVLRGVNDGALEPVTPQPIKETTYRDTRVRRGSRYTYAVIAVDTATPPNRSGESNRVEETVR
jgi:hypothetical protein